VLAGFEVRESDLSAFNGFLEATGYWHQVERSNEAYSRFLLHREASQS
jgi:hypothetical protein